MGAALSRKLLTFVGAAAAAGVAVAAAAAAVAAGLVEAATLACVVVYRHLPGLCSPQALQ